MKIIILWINGFLKEGEYVAIGSEVPTDRSLKENLYPETLRIINRFAPNLISLREEALRPGKNFAAKTMQEGEPVGNWEDTLELLRRQGWEYTYAKFIDLEAQEEFYWVSINRGNQNLTSLWPTLEEASVNVNQFLVAGTV